MNTYCIQFNIYYFQCFLYEKDISFFEYQSFINACQAKGALARSIKKIRYIYKYEDLIWEVDDFNNGYRLIIAEIEIPNKNFKFKIPSFIRENLLLEVSGMKQFSNRSLSIPMVDVISVKTL